MRRIPGVQKNYALYLDIFRYECKHNWISLLENAVQIAPCSRYLYELSLAYDKFRYRSKAKKALEMAIQYSEREFSDLGNIEINRQKLRCLEKKVEILLREENDKEAENILTQMIQENPLNAKSYFLLGSLWKKRRNRKSAENYFSKACLRDPKMKIIAKNKEFLICDRQKMQTQETKLGCFVADSLYEEYRVDAVLLRADAIIASLPKGAITKYHLYRAMPYEKDFPVIVNLKGSHLRRILEQSVINYPKPNRNFLQVSGISFAFYPKKTYRKIQKIMIKGIPLQPKRIYTILINEGLLHSYTNQAKQKLVRNSYNNTVRDIVLRHLRRNKIHKIKQGRIQIKK